MIVLDTHAWVWWVSDPSRLSAVARRTIDEARNEEAIRISSISCWEVALLADKGRLELTMDVSDWIAKSEALSFLAFVPVDNRIALKATRLPGFEPKDPADRMIIATTVCLGASLVTKDSGLRGYSDIETIW